MSEKQHKMKKLTEEEKEEEESEQCPIWVEGSSLSWLDAAGEIAHHQPGEPLEGGGETNAGETGLHS